MNTGTEKIIIAASILGADPLNLERDLKAVQETGQAEWVQVDVMDGLFAANLSFGPDTVAAIKKKFPFFIDVHLMMERPKNVLEAFARKGADLITVHLEAKDNPEECLRLIKNLGVKAGLAVKPKTPIKEIFPFLELLDLVLVMTVEPGFAGQGFLESCLPKIEEARRMIQKAGGGRWLEVDGGINDQTAPKAARAGADVLVCGSALFREPPKITLARMRETIQKTLK
ncbi:MAG: ribulose-phosphate 3-epimerase [Elusimicrobia bacterium]|nr:ribulose-phosphate 3-epimerase [Elusimicrobiota bacterium]